MADSTDDPAEGPEDGSRPAAEREPDYRFTLANERTFLAWVRTALALLAGAVAVLHLVPLDWAPLVRVAVGLWLAGLAVVISGYAPVRWLRVQRAMRRDERLPLSPLPVLTAIGVGLVCVTVLVGHLWP